MLLNVVFTVNIDLAGGANFSNTLFVGANPTFTNANNLVLTSDASTGINIAKQFIAQVSKHAMHKCPGLVPMHVHGHHASPVLPGHVSTKNKLWAN